MENYSNEKVVKDRTLVNVNLSEYSDKLKELDWWVFEIIVSKGISEEKEAKDICRDDIIVKYGIHVGSDSLWRSIKLLVNINFFTVIKINTGYRNFNLLNLTEIGALAYINKFKRKPAIQEHVLIHSHHASYHHGYMIKDTKAILERIGLYRNVETRRDKNIIRFYDGAICIPDIIAVMSNSEAHYYEVECGNHHQFDINEKCDKLARLTKHIIYVGQNRKSVCGILRKQLEAWIEYRGREELLRLGIKVYLTTISDLSDKKWTYFYDMKTDKPICCFKEKEEK